MFSLALRWLPSSGSGTIWHLIMPMTALGLYTAGTLARFTRSAMLEVLGKLYMRAAAAKGVSEAFGSRIRLFSLITNTLAKDKEIQDGWRRYPRPGSARNRANMVEDEVVDALFTEAVDGYFYREERDYRGIYRILNAQIQEKARTPFAGSDQGKSGASCRLTCGFIPISARSIASS